VIAAIWRDKCYRLGTAAMNVHLDLDEPILSLEPVFRWVK
jgi:hypothetical protein